MIAIGYARRSQKPTRRRAESERTISIEDQGARIAAYCHEQHWKLGEILIDDGVSGGRRERLERIAARVRALGAHRVVVYHLDRFARDVAGLLDELRAMSRRGVELHVVGRGRIEADTATGFLMTGVEGLMAEHYRRLIAEKTRDAMSRLRGKGRRVSRWPPYGFRFSPDGRVLPDTHEQSTLGEIKRLSGLGTPLRGISSALVAQGITARNGRAFAPSTLSRLVPNGAVRDKRGSESVRFPVPS